MEKTLPIIEVPSDGKPNWYEGAYCLFFVYSKKAGNFIIKGYRREAEKYLKENYTHYFYYSSMWSHGKSRGHWHFWKDDVIIFEPSRASKTFKFRVIQYDKHKYSYEKNRKFEKEFKRLPKRWIPEFNKL
jgi:hypothetical protein